MSTSEEYLELPKQQLANWIVDAEEFLDTLGVSRGEYNDFSLYGRILEYKILRDDEIASIETLLKEAFAVIEPMAEGKSLPAFERRELVMKAAEVSKKIKDLFGNM